MSEHEAGTTCSACGLSDGFHAQPCTGVRAKARYLSDAAKGQPRDLVEHLIEAQARSDRESLEHFRAELEYALAEFEESPAEWRAIFVSVVARSVGHYARKVMAWDELDDTFPGVSERA